MRLKLLKYKTNNYLRHNTALRSSLPYKQAASIGVIFSVEDKTKHDDVKDFVRKLEHDGKHVKVLTYRPKNKENYEFMYDFFTDKDVNFWGSITSESVNKFVDMPFDFLFYLDVNPNPLILNILARSKAKCRVGKFWDSGKRYFEFMIEAKNGTRTLIDGMYSYTASLR
jgi:hypothetical protein